MLDSLFTYGGGISNFNKIGHPALDERRLAIVKGKLILQSRHLNTKILYKPVLYHWIVQNGLKHKLKVTKSGTAQWHEL